MLVISIQSQVVHGHVGASAAVFPMQAAGVEVASVPTVLLSNHPHYPTLRGRALPADLVADLLLGVEERGLVDRAAVLLTGYLGAPDVAGVVATFSASAKARNPRLIHVCDPVMGDDDLGLFVDPALPALFRDRLIPSADIVTPNPYELEALTGRRAQTLADLERIAGDLRRRGPHSLVATGCTLADTPDGKVETILCAPDGAHRFATPRLPIRPCGTGDLLAGLFAAGLAKGQAQQDALRAAVAGVFAILQRTQDEGAEEMRIVGTPLV